MTRALQTLLKGLLMVGTILASLASTPAQAEVRIEISPPSWYIATSRPVYYEGRPSYWYNDRWYYRDGRSWRTYNDEPRFLREHRERRAPERHFYGRDHDGGFRHRR
jgi:hypothetical protein